MGTKEPFERRRGSFFLVFDKVSIFPILGLIFFVILPAWRGSFDWNYLFLFIILCLGMIQKAYVCLTTYFTVGDEYLLVESGIIQKKRLELSYHTITAVDLSRNLLFQAFGYSLVRIDNAGSSEGSSTVRLALKTPTAEQLRDTVKAKKREIQTDANSGMDLDANMDSPEEELIEAMATVSVADLAKLGFMRSKILYYATVIPALLVVWRVIAGVFLSGNEDILYTWLLQVPSYWYYVFLVVIAYLVILVFSIVKTIVTFYNFRLQRSAENLYIDYGLFSKKHYTIPLHKISGVRLEQSVFMRLRHYFTAKICVIGLGGDDEDDGDSANLLYPVGNIATLSKIFEQTVPFFHFEGQRRPVERRALRYFFMRPIPILLLLSQVVSLFTGVYPYIFINLFFLLLALISSYLLYKNAGYHLGDEDVIIYGGGFLRHITGIRREKIESITVYGSVWKQRRGFGSVNIGFLAPAAMSHAVGRNLRQEDYHVIAEHLDF